MERRKFAAEKIMVMQDKFVLEICAGSYASALAAREGGAQRIELCCALGEGGLTPSLGLLAAVNALGGIKKHVLVRPRGGDFLYTDEEKKIMFSDISALLNFNYDGIVVGSLTADGRVDKAFLKKCVELANGKSVTFHRAFDLCDDPLRALDDIMDCGCNRLLTSGQAATAEQGIPLIKKLVERAGKDFCIMPGCGVTSGNAARILSETGATEIHASARSLQHSKMRFRHRGVSMGAAGTDEYAVMETSVQEVRNILQSI